MIGTRRVVEYNIGLWFLAFLPIVGAVHVMMLSELIVRFRNTGNMFYFGNICADSLNGRVDELHVPRKYCVCW